MVRADLPAQPARPPLAGCARRHPGKRRVDRVSALPLRVGRDRPTREPLRTAGLLGAGASAALNVLLFFGAQAAGVNMVEQYEPAGADMGTKVVPALMHVFSGGAIEGSLLTRGRRA